MDEEKNDFLESVQKDGKMIKNENASKNYLIGKYLLNRYKFSIIFPLFFIVANIIFVVFFIIVNPGWGGIILLLDYFVPINFPGFIASMFLGFKFGQSFIIPVIITIIFYFLVGLLIDQILYMSKTYISKIRSK